jgi:hypothetical protein
LSAVTRTAAETRSVSTLDLLFRFRLTHKKVQSGSLADFDNLQSTKTGGGEG